MPLADGSVLAVEAGTERGGGAFVGLFRTVGTALVTQPRILSWLPPLAWAALIFALSEFPPRLDSESVFAFGGFTTNLGHPFAFGILALLLVPLLPRRRGPHGLRWTALGSVGALWVIVIAGLYGFTDELHQSTIPGRDASLLDALSDFTGAFFSIKVVLYLGRDDATSRGLLRWLGGGFVGCCAAAGLATWYSHAVGAGPWPF